MKTVRYSVNYLGDIEAFHRRFELPPGEWGGELQEFRLRFMLEELGELVAAWEHRNLEKYLDSLVDIAYVALGTVYLRDMTHLIYDELPGLCKEAESGYIFARPALPNAVDFARALAAITPPIANFTLSQEQAAYAALYLMSGITMHALGQDLNFPEAWRRVHAANMQKVRTRRPEDSTRKSVWDVVKPPGWVGPNLQDLCQPTPFTLADR